MTDGFSGGLQDGAIPFLLLLVLTGACPGFHPVHAHSSVISLSRSELSSFRSQLSRKPGSPFLAIFD